VLVREGTEEENLRVGLSRDVHLVAVHAKGVDQVLPETHELGGELLLVGDGGLARREARADRLLNVDDVGQGVPAPGVLDWLVGAILPQEGAVLLEETLKGRASGLYSVSLLLKECLELRNSRHRSAK
jgi:hypothetical protein